MPIKLKRRLRTAEASASPCIMSSSNFASSFAPYVSLRSLCRPCSLDRQHTSCDRPLLPMIQPFTKESHPQTLLASPKHGSLIKQRPTIRISRVAFPHLAPPQLEAKVLRRRSRAKPTSGRQDSACVLMHWLLLPTS